MNLDFEGKAYTEASTLQRQWGQSLLYETNLCGDEVILDLGCGDGVLTSAWAARVPSGRVVGIDSSPGMLAYAKSVNARPNIEYRIDDLEDLRPEFSTYDLIISNAALHWVQGHEKLLPRLYDMLRTGGRVRLSFGAAGNCRTFFAVARGVMRLPPFSDSFTDFIWPWRNETVERYREILAETPFSDFQVWGQVEDTAFPDIEAIVAWMEQPLLVPFLNHLPPSLRHSFRDTVISNMLAASRQSDGIYFEYFRKINVLAFRDCRILLPRSMAMLEASTGLIRMSPVQSDTWQIELPFFISGPIGRYDVELVLDHQMIPLGAEYQGGSSLQLGLPLQVSMNLSMARNNLHIDPEHRLVQFGITWFDLSQTWKSGRYSVRKTIPFKWVSRLGPPNSVELNLKVRGVFGGTILQERVIGLNLSSRLIIPVLFNTPSQKSFYFSNTGDLSLFGYRDVVRIGTALLNGGDRASWAFTGPDDTELWDSDVGTDMVRSQYRRILDRAGKEWVGRLALDPYELGVEGPQRARFAEMMEVQSLCGIDLRVVSPIHVERTTGSAHRVLGGFGAGFAAEWEWGKPLVEPENAVFHFEQDRISALLGQYEEISAHSMSWKQYKQVQGLVFTPDRESRIMERVRQIKGSPKEIKSVPKQIDSGAST